MGFHFRKRIKIAPGVNLNIGKKSVGVSVGGKHGGLSLNSKTGARARVSAPGTGLSYSEKIGGKSKKKDSSNKSSSFFHKNKDYLLKWQQVITDNKSDKLVMSERELLQHTQLAVQSSLKIIQDCVRLVNETLTPNVFFDRYDLLLEHATKIAEYEPFYSFVAPLPSEQLEVLIEKRPLATHDFIERYWNSVQLAISKLKTDKAKKNRLEKFFQTMDEYTNRMDDSNLEYLEQLRLESSISD